MQYISWGCTIILIFTYGLPFYFLHKKGESVFIRCKSFYKIDLFIAFSIVSAFLFILWNSYFYNYQFLGLSISKENDFLSDKIISFLGVIFAIVGWLFSVRSQLVINMRNHSMQTILNSRLSECYVNKFDSLTKIVNWSEKCSVPYYETLSDENKATVHYVLNYYEFFAIGVRYNEFDESIVKSMMKGPFLKTYNTFENVISFIRQESPNSFEHLSKLNEYWKD